MSFRSALLTAVFSAAAALAVSPAAFAGNYPPPVLTGANNPNPGLIITFNANGSITTTGTGVPYITEDEYVEIVNNTSSSIRSLNLVTPHGASTGIFAFDGDGIDGYGGGSNALDTTGYGGGDAYFTNYANGQTGTVNFIGTGINGGGGEGYFSLEGVINISQNLIPEPATFAMFGVGLASLTLLRRRRNSVS